MRNENEKSDIQSSIGMSNQNIVNQMSIKGFFDPYQSIVKRKMSKSKEILQNSREFPNFWLL